MSTKAHFQLQFEQFKHVAIPRQMVLASSWQCSIQAWYAQICMLHTKTHYILHSYTHLAYQSILHCTRETLILHASPQDMSELWCMAVMHKVLSRLCYRLVWGTWCTNCEYRKLPLLQPQMESVKTNFALLDAHLGSALVRDVVMQSTQHEIWLPQMSN